MNPPTATVAHALVLLCAALFLGAGTVRATLGWPSLTSGGDAACPTSSPGWLETGVYGGIVDPDDDLLDTNGTPGLLFHFYPLGAGAVTSAAECKSACETWPNFHNKVLLPLNGKRDLCAYWTWSGGEDCYLYGCGVCKSAVSFSTTAECALGRYVTGGVEASARCEGGGVKGDPHFTGADKSHFDFTGVPDTNYCLVSDSHLHINAFYGGRYAAWGNESSKPLTWIRQVGILWGHHSIRLTARSGGRWQYDGGYMAKMEVDGKEVQLAQAGDSARLAGDRIRLAWIAGKRQSASDEVDVYELKIEGVLALRLTLRPEVAKLRTREDGVVHFDLNFDAIDLSNDAHGVLGQTYRADHMDRLSRSKLVFNKLLGVEAVEGANGEGFLDGTPGDYASSGVMAPDCKMSQFARLDTLDEETSRAIGRSKASAISTHNAPRKVLGLPGVDSA